MVAKAKMVLHAFAVRTALAALEWMRARERHAWLNEGNCSCWMSQYAATAPCYAMSWSEYVADV